MAFRDFSHYFLRDNFANKQGFLTNSCWAQCSKSFNLSLALTLSVSTCSDDNFLMASSSFISQATMCILPVAVFSFESFVHRTALTKSTIAAVLQLQRLRWLSMCFVSEAFREGNSVLLFLRFKTLPPVLHTQIAQMTKHGCPRSVVFYLGSRPPYGSWTIFGGVASRYLRTQLYYISFIRVLDRVAGL